MKRLSILLLSVVMALAACGGQGKQVSTARSPGGEGDDPATPFDDAAVKAALTDTPGVAACGADPESTMGAHFAAQRAAMKGGDASVVINETFTCRAQADDSWACRWALFTTPPGGAHAIAFTVASSGSLVRDSIACDAPG
ncbi:MAG: hypothetical protein K8M05_26530 [Deltaproteobacteria bacterium]|nr:hypothetical protein [Kofleriaceae bacterium]